MLLLLSVFTASTVVLVAGLDFMCFVLHNDRLRCLNYLGSVGDEYADVLSLATGPYSACWIAPNTATVGLRVIVLAMTPQLRVSCVRALRDRPACPLESRRTASDRHRWISSLLWLLAAITHVSTPVGDLSL